MCCKIHPTSQEERKLYTLCVQNRVKDNNKCDEKVRSENSKKSFLLHTEKTKGVIGFCALVKSLYKLYTHNISSCGLVQDFPNRN